jgi:hypothetical protein
MARCAKPTALSIIAPNSAAYQLLRLVPHGRERDKLPRGALLLLRCDLFADIQGAIRTSLTARRARPRLVRRQLEEPEMTSDLGIDQETFAKQSKLFQLLDAAGRERMMTAAKAVSFEPGEVVVREGEDGAGMYVIKSGTVSVDVEALAGDQQVATLGPGSVFGEIAVIMEQARQATVTAEDAVEAWRFDKQDIDVILADYPKVREVLARLGLKRSELTLEKMLDS